MFFSADVEVALQLKSFKNIAIRQPSQLILKVSVSHQDQFLGTMKALPISILKCSLVSGVRRKDNFDEFSSSHMDSEASFYISKHICIRYQDEEAGINEICLFKTKINAYPYSTLKNTKLTIKFELSQSKCLIGNSMAFPVQPPTCTTTFPLTSTGRAFQAYFDSFSLASCVQGAVYTRIINYQHLNNKQQISQIITHHTEKQRKLHVSYGGELTLPRHFQDFGGFMEFATENWAKGKVQDFYDDYVEGLKKQVTAMKKMLNQYLETLENKEEVLIMNMGLIRRISACMPDPAFMTRRQKKRIFTKNQEGDQNPNHTRESLNISMVQNIDLGATRYCSVKISDLNLSAKSLQECFLTDFNNIGRLVYDLWGEYLSLVSLYPNPKYYENLKLQSQNRDRLRHISQNTKVAGESPRSKSGQCKTLFIFNNRQQLKFFIEMKPKIQCSHHLVILVHGFQAYSMDLQKVRNILKLYFPGLLIYSATSNQGNSKDCIEVMGQRLAVQIKNHLNTLTGRIAISLVCHSLGGLVARAALPYLSLYRTNFANFISICSPHLGYLFHSSTLIKTGLWVINKMQKSGCLVELCCQDVNLNQQKCYLEILSQMEGLNWFKNVVLLASRQDQYVNYESSRIEKDNSINFNKQSPQTKAYSRMLNRLHDRLQHTNTIRLEVQFEQEKQSNFNSFIGRTAHIKLLLDTDSLQILASLLRPLFSQALTAH